MRRPYFRTYTGRLVHPLDPSPGEISIFDVAHSLSQICRFLGHTKEFYSVAQHSILVSQHAVPEDALWGLLHDASEAYICDMPSPLKHDPRMAIYRETEALIMAAVCSRYDLGPQMPMSVEIADKRLLATEFRDVTTVDAPEWVREECGFDPLSDYHIACWAPSFAESMFLNRFEELTK